MNLKRLEVTIMWKRLHRLLPQTFKYRLFLSFLLLLILPVCIMLFYLFQEIETFWENKVGEQMHQEQERVNKSLEDVMSFSYKTQTLIAQDDLLTDILKNPAKFDPLDRKNRIESKFRSINNSFFTQMELYYKLIDQEGNVYTSYLPREQLVNEKEGFQKSLASFEKEKTNYRWVTDDPNDVLSSITSSPHLLSLNILLKDDNNHAYGLARISIDYLRWFQLIRKNFAVEQDYFLMSQTGEMIAQSGKATLFPDTIRSILTNPQKNAYFKNTDHRYMVNYNYIDSLNWYVVNQIPLDAFFKELNTLRNWFVIFLDCFLVGFIFITFLIASKMTHPLRLLQRKMNEAVRKKLRTRLDVPADSSVEIVSLAGTFNEMIADIQELIGQLQLEERQKQAAQFQLLMFQMNPHFLLNTLNTVKWIARREKQHQISEICLSLGQLLEAGLSLETELLKITDELRLVEAYAYIQKFRYRDQFSIHYEINESIRYALVPKLSLQPLVENAIYHGFASLERLGNIWIHIYPEHTQLVIEVTDDGMGLQENDSTVKKRKGIGLTNLKERLRLLFRDRAELKIIPQQQGVKVRIRMPLLVSEPYMEGVGLHVENNTG